VSNAAAGLGFFLGLLGMYIAFRERGRVSHLRSGQPYVLVPNEWLQQQSQKTASGTPNPIFAIFITFAILEFLLAMAALIFSFVYDNMTAGNTISLALASQEIGQHYTKDNWAPGTWFGAVLALPLASQSDRDFITSHIHVMKASKWMLVPIYIVAFAVMVAGILGFRQNRRARMMSDERWLESSRVSGAKGMR